MSADPIDLELPPLGTVMGVGMVALAGLAGSWWVLAGGRRRHDEDEPEPPTAAALATVYRASTATRPSAAARPTEAARRRAPADWELASAFDDAPIGTVEFDGDADELPPDIQAALEAPVVHAEPGNARTRRTAQARQWREDSDRHSLLHRVGLPGAEEDI
jgi:hypothetical protein